MDKDSMLRVGVITTTHGVRGEVKVFPTTDDPARFKKLKKAYLDFKSPYFLYVGFVGQPYYIYRDVRFVA